MKLEYAIPVIEDNLKHGNFSAFQWTFRSAVEEVMRHLKEYRDTGLTPEAIVRLNDFSNSQSAKLLAENSRLKARLEEAEKSKTIDKQDYASCKGCEKRETEDCPLYFYSCMA